MKRIRDEASSKYYCGLKKIRIFPFSISQNCFSLLLKEEAEEIMGNSSSSWEKADILFGKRNQKTIVKTLFFLFQRPNWWIWLICPLTLFPRWFLFSATKFFSATQYFFTPISTETKWILSKNGIGEKSKENLQMKVRKAGKAFPEIEWLTLRIVN